MRSKFLGFRVINSQNVCIKGQHFAFEVDISHNFGLLRSKWVKTKVLRSKLFSFYFWVKKKEKMVLIITGRERGKVRGRRQGLVDWWLVTSSRKRSFVVGFRLRSLNFTTTHIFKSIKINTNSSDYRVRYQYRSNSIYSYYFIIKNHF